MKRNLGVHHGDTETTEKRINLFRERSIFFFCRLRVLRVSVVNLFLFLCFPLFQGCSLLFVAKGGTHYVAEKKMDRPDAASLSAKMNGPVAVDYRTQAGDTFFTVSQRFFGKISRAEKIASANRMNVNKTLKKGTLLKISEPLLYPDPHDPVSNPPKKTTSLGSAFPPKAPAGAAPTSTPEPPKIDKISRPKLNRAFGPGEKLKFEIRALGILGGYASMEVGNYTMVAGRPCLSLTIRANSVFPLTSLFPVSDVQTSYFDSVDFLSWKFENNVHEGNYKAHNLEIYDQLKHDVVRRHNDEASEKLDIAAFSQDIISCFYYFRLLPFEEGKTYDIPTQSGGKNYHLLVTVGKKERITVPAGTFDCLKVKPLIQQGTVFRNNEDIDLWVTDDDKHIPVKIKSGIVIGSIDVDLLDATIPTMK